MALSRVTGEVLQDLGMLGMERSIAWTVVQSEMGDGAHAGVTVGSAAGVRHWRLKWDAIFDDVPMISPVRGNGSPIEGGTPQMRPIYLWRFLYRRFSNFDDMGLYFWVWDFFDNLYYAARLEDYAIAYAQVTSARQWSTGLSIVEVRQTGSPALKAATIVPAPVPPAYQPLIEPTANP